MWDIADADVELLDHRKLTPNLKDSRGRSISSDYFQGWQAADVYAYKVITGERTECKQVINCCKRYAYDRLVRTDLEFLTNKANSVIDFANRLRHVKGPATGRPVLLLPWMIFILTNLYAWYMKEGERKGERRFTQVLALVARGNAKSFILSIVSLYTMIINKNGSPSCYSVARNRDQARIVLDDARKMAQSADSSIKKYFAVTAHKIETPRNHGLFKALSSDSQSADGLRIALGIVDELHAHTSGDLLQTIRTGTGATLDPIVFCISTAGFQLEGVCVQERDLGRLINSGVADNTDHYFAIEFTIDDEDDWEDEKNWPKANPSIGHAVSLNDLRGKASEAKHDVIKRAHFLTKHLDVFVNSNDSAYVDILDVQKCASSLDFKNYAGREVYAGLDLAQYSDLAALSLIFPEDNGGITIKQKHYIPERALNKATPVRKELYLRMKEKGCLTICKGNTIDFDLIKADIREAAEEFDLKMVGYDPYCAAQLAKELTDEGIVMVEVRQGYANMNEPAKNLQRLILDQLLSYDETDICFEWCAANAVQSTDNNENIKVHKAKDKPHDKVDSIIALITGLAVATLREGVKVNPYKSRGLTML